MRLQNLGSDGDAIAAINGSRLRCSFEIRSSAGCCNPKGLEKFALHGVCDCLQAIMGVEFLIDVV